MPKQIVEINTNNYSLNMFRGFLLVKNAGVEVGRVVLEDIVSVVLSAPDAVITKNLMSELAHHNIPVVFCNEVYLPTSVAIPLSSHYKSRLVLEHQINAKTTLKKRLWQSTVKEKILNQSKVLQYFYPCCSEHDTLKDMANSVMSGDSTFMESQSARLYFSKIFNDDFKRESESKDILNVALNYGYIVLRSSAARSLVASGLNTHLGIFHKNNYNPFCLADDIMEIYRPLVDFTVKNMNLSGVDILTPKIKQELAKIIHLDVLHNGENVPIYNVFNYIAQSLVSSFKMNDNLLNFGTIKI